MLGDGPYIIQFYKTFFGMAENGYDKAPLEVEAAEASKTYSADWSNKKTSAFKKALVFVYNLYTGLSFTAVIKRA